MPSRASEASTAPALPRGVFALSQIRHMWRLMRPYHLCVVYMLLRGSPRGSSMWLQCRGPVESTTSQECAINMCIIYYNSSLFGMFKNLSCSQRTLRGLFMPTFLPSSDQWHTDDNITGMLWENLSHKTCIWTQGWTDWCGRSRSIVTLKNWK